jgi:hypothetical protein
MSDLSAGASPYATRGHILRRGRAGLARRALATFLGVSELAIQTWEAGRDDPGLFTKVYGKARRSGRAPMQPKRPRRYARAAPRAVS